MVHWNSNLNSADSGFSRVSQREAMAPGYQVHKVRSAVERISVRRALDWVRRHPGYISTPSQHALDSMNNLARSPR